MRKPDPYSEWAIFTSRRDKTGNSLPLPDELLAAARAAWPEILAQVRRERIDRPGTDKTSLAADIWEQVLQSVSKTLLRKRAARSRITNLQSYLIGAFRHRFNRELKRERRRGETIQLVESIEELERLKGAQDARSASDLERAITVREIAAHMDEWTRHVWEARQVGYSWKEIALHLGQSEQSVKMKFRYGLEKTRKRLAEVLRRPKPKGPGNDERG
jgi:DNA-directed RNA polymerase specialized sigma24 family protein